jgi:hypothetical protein
MLEITGIQVERVQDISSEDAIAEGMEPNGGAWMVSTQKMFSRCVDPRDTFRDLWDSINFRKPGCSWADNPWVWKISFKVKL